MKLFTGLALCGLGLTTALLLGAPGCSSSTTETDGGASASTGASKKPPAKAGDQTASTDSKFFAVKTIQLGDADRSGALSQTAWKKYGYDLDGLVSTEKSTDHCKLKAGASSKAKLDGDQGTDNSFGANILPLLLAAAPDAPKLINDNLTSGTFTVIIEAKGLDGSAEQTNTGLSGQLFAGAQLATPPKWDGTDEWAVLPGLLKDGQSVAGGSKVSFADAYINKGLFVSGADATVTLSLSLGGASLDLTINKATISFKKPASGVLATEGTIAGVLGTEQLITELKKVASRVSTTLCEGSAVDNIAGQIRQASDIGSNGANTAGVECDGISIGIGFTAAQVKAPTKVQAPGPPGPDPCSASADAGAGD
jgi:hypothetical protein